MKTILSFFLLLFAFGLTAQSSAPVNPEFIEYQKKLKEGTWPRFTDSGNALGLIPSPGTLHFSHGEPISKSQVLSFPAIYDLRTLGLVTSVKNQNPFETCWTFSSLGAIESNWLKNGFGTFNLSESNMATCHGYEWDWNYGGNSFIAAAYLTRISGPVSETDDPYSRLSQGLTDCIEGLSPVAYQTQARFFPNDMNTIKQSLMDHGAVYTNYHHEDVFYHNVSKTYYYSGTESSNHAVLLVGWDDNKTVPGAPGNGAWIAKNSWGTGWGESGYFYISYYDSMINSETAVFISRKDHNQDAKLYFYDELHPWRSVGYGKETAYGLVKFYATEEQTITQLGSYTNTQGTVLDFEIYRNFNSGVLSGMIGSLYGVFCDFPGYHMFELEEGIDIVQGDFYVKVRYHTPGYNWPVPFEAYEEEYQNPQIESGVCWISSSGTSSSWFAFGSNVAGYERDLSIRAYAVPKQSIKSKRVTFNVKDKLGNPVPDAKITIIPDLAIALNSSQIFSDADLKDLSPDTLIRKMRTSESKKDSSPSVMFSTENDTGIWIHWDNGINSNGIGIGGSGGPFYVASRWTTEDIGHFNGFHLTGLRMFIRDMPNSITAKIWQGSDSENLVEKINIEVSPVNANSWNTIELPSPYLIDGTKELWFGYEVLDPGAGVWPAGCDNQSEPDGKGNKVKMSGGAWLDLSEYDLAGMWNLQAFIESMVLFTDADGIAIFDLFPGSYSYTVEKENLNSASGNFSVDVMDLTIDVILFDNKLVTFNVDLTDVEGFNPFEHDVFLTGSFTEWAIPGTETSVAMDLLNNSSQPPYNFHEDWEKYEDFTTDLSPWTTHQLSSGETWMPAGFDFPGAGEEFAWIVFNPSQTNPPIDDDEPAYDGQKMAACIQYQGLNDDKWLISPELSFHITSMVSFMARSITDLYGLERIRVLVSTSGTEPNDFTQISPGDFMEVPVDWTEFSFELGIYAGETGYIAIQYVSYDAFILFLDEFKVEADYIGFDTLIYTATVPIDIGQIEYKYFSNAFGNGMEGAEWDGEPFRTAFIESDTIINDIWGKKANPDKFLLTLEVNPVNAGTVTGSGMYEKDAEININAMPESMYSFVNWTDEEGNEVSAEPEFIFMMPGNDVELTANFALIEYKVDLIVDPEGSGSVTGSGDYAPGDEVQIEAVPANAYAFVSWTDSDGLLVSEGPVYNFNMPENDVILTANFALIKYKVDLIVDPVGSGTVTGGGDYAPGDGVQIEAVPANAYSFVSWTDSDGLLVSEGPVYNFNMPENDVILTANFALIQYSVMIDIEPVNAGHVEGSGNYLSGDLVKLKAIPESGYNFESWTDSDGMVLWEKEEYNFYMPEIDLNLTANFTLAEYSITIDVEPENGGTVSGNRNYYFGEDVVLQAFSNEGFDFIHWMDHNDVGVCFDEVYEFKMPFNDLYFKAVFEKTVSTDHMYSSDINIFPNPAQDYFLIISQNNIASVEISDVNGRVIYTKDIGNTSVFVQYPFKSGMYMVKFYTSTGLYVKKLVIHSKDN